MIIFSADMDVALSAFKYQSCKKKDCCIKLDLGHKGQQTVLVYRVFLTDVTGCHVGIQVVSTHDNKNLSRKDSSHISMAMIYPVIEQSFLPGF